MYLPTGLNSDVSVIKCRSLSKKYIWQCYGLINPINRYPLMFRGQMFQSLNNLPESVIKIVVSNYEICIFIASTLQACTVLQSAFEIFLLMKSERVL